MDGPDAAAQHVVAQLREMTPGRKKNADRLQFKNPIQAPCIGPDQIGAVPAKLLVSAVQSQPEPRVNVIARTDPHTPAMAIHVSDEGQGMDGHTSYHTQWTRF